MTLNITPVNNRLKTILQYVVSIAVVLGLMILMMVGLSRLVNPPQEEAGERGGEEARETTTLSPSPAPTDTSDPIIAFILVREGGYNPRDPSFEGVYQPTYDWFREVKQLHDAPRNVRDLEGRMDIVHQFYQWHLYELRSGITEVPDWFQLMLADFWVTSMSVAIRPLQAWAGVEVDGVWGPHTEAAVMQMFDRLEDKPKFARWYTDQRKAFYRRHGYGESHGLLARADIVEAETLMKLHGNETHHRSMEEVDMRVHAPVESLSLEERLARLEKLLDKR